MAKTFKFGENGKWATKTGSSLAYNDQNDNFKPMPFSVTRDSIATRVNKEGLIEVVGKDKLRIDYKDSTKGVALLEPARTNSYTYSEDFSQWNSSRLETPIAEIVSPDGSVNGYKMQQSSGFTSAPNVYFGSVSAGTYTISIFAKKGTRNYLAIAFDGVTYFDVENGVLGSVGSGHTAKIENYGNEWYRCSTTKTITTSQASAFYFADRDNSLTSNDDEGYMYAFGAQLEAGSYATSYIPTSGASVPRAADVANGAGNSEVFNDSEGVLFANTSALANDGTYRNICLSDGGLTNRILIQYTPTSNQINIVVIYSGGQYSLSHTVSNVKYFSKFLIKYKANDLALWVNGFEVDTSTNSDLPIGLNTLSFDNTIGDAFYSKTKEIGYYDAVLTDAELEALTSYTSFTNMANELNLTIK